MNNGTYLDRRITDVQIISVAASFNRQLMERTKRRITIVRREKDNDKIDAFLIDRESEARRRIEKNATLKKEEADEVYFTSKKSDFVESSIDDKDDTRSKQSALERFLRKINPGP